jgi:hypothetical protein
MSSLISIYQNLTQKPLSKFLIIFSLCMSIIAGVVWACSDDSYELRGYSAFAPGYFVNKQYTLFSYEGYSVYYAIDSK